MCVTFSTLWFYILVLGVVGGIRLEASSRCLGPKKKTPAPCYWHMREKQRGAVSSNSRFQTVPLQQELRPNLSRLEHAAP